MSSVLSLPLTSQPTPPAMDPALAGGGAQAGGASGGVDPTTGQPMAVDLTPFSAQGIGMGGLQRNPQLPQHPLGAYTDSQYEAQLAQLKQEIAQRYNDVLQQLGYTDDNGNFVPGSVETQANRQKSELARNINLADEQTTQQHQQQGTLFSGLRGTAQARAEYPYVNAIGQLGVDVPKQLGDLYGQAGGLVNEFTVRHNLMLADAAQRAATNLANNSAAGGVNITGAAGGTIPGAEGMIQSPVPGMISSGQVRPPTLGDPNAPPTMMGSPTAGGMPLVYEPAFPNSTSAGGLTARQV